MSWIRLYAMSFTITLGLVYQVKQMVVGLMLSTRRSTVITLSTSCSHIALMIVISDAWVFSVPLDIVVSVIPFIAYFLLAIGKESFETTPSLTNQLLRQTYSLTTQAVLVLVYPTLNAIFAALSPIHQAVSVFVLPTIKMIMENVVA
uniref:Uncharacterized protein n=1 Tax=Globisporangium ultimum (strain ATCC 200006 / CBS 805.95 / DAOM BR144) TaxID=431595 RepID=K3X545_GLOUD